MMNPALLLTGDMPTETVMQILQDLTDYDVICLAHTNRQGRKYAYTELFGEDGNGGRLAREIRLNGITNRGNGLTKLKLKWDAMMTGQGFMVRFMANLTVHEKAALAIGRH